MTEHVARKECRGWPLVREIARLSAGERSAAEGHLELCRRCSTRFEEQTALERRLAAAGSTTLATALAALAARTVGGVANALPFSGGGVAGPVAALATSVLVTAGVGGVVAGVRTVHAAPVPTPHRVVATVPPRAPAANLRDSAPSAQPALTAGTAPSTGRSLPGAAAPSGAPMLRLPVLPAPLPTASTTLAVPLPVPTTTLLPLPGVTVSPLPITSILPTSIPLPLPTASVSAPTLSTSPPPSLLPLP